MTRSAAIEADLARVPHLVGTAARTVVAAPPSDADPLWDEMRVIVSDKLTSRAFDPGAAIVTGAPIPYVTEGGIPYVTESDVPYVTEVIL